MIITKRAFMLASATMVGSGIFSRSVLGADALAVNYNIDPINQGQSNLCWAAATAMLLNWPVPNLYNMKSVAKAGGPGYVTLYDNASEIDAVSEANLYKKLNLKVETSFSPTIEGWYKLLKNKGPLHVTIKQNGSNGMLHGVLLTGLVGDGTAPNTTIYFNDPATGTKESQPVSDFVKLYDGSANWVNNIIHQP